MKPPSQTLLNEMIGKTFGKLTIVSHHGRNSSDNIWKCLCECGSTAYVRTGNLRHNQTTSCGCLKLKGNPTHGLSKHPLYKVFHNMKDRCENSNSQSYKDYGGRGIEVVKEWSDNFEAFYEWSLDNGFESGLTIERKDNDGNYEPDNCRWASHQEQMQNKRTTRFSPEDIRNIRKDTRSIIEISKEYGTNHEQIRRIITGDRWDNIT